MTVKNLQANSLIEQLHGPLGEQLHSITLACDHWHEDFDEIFQAFTFSVQVTMPSHFPYLPLKLVLGMKIISGQKIIVDWEQVKQLHHEHVA